MLCLSDQDVWIVVIHDGFRSDGFYADKGFLYFGHGDLLRTINYITALLRKFNFDCTR